MDDVATIVVDELNSAGNFNINKVYSNVSESLTEADLLHSIKQNLENKFGQ